MKKRRISHTIGALTLISSFFAENSLAQKPNVVFILSDDAGYADFGFQSKRLIPTPNIDRIASEGVIFTNGYVTAAVCCPSRAGILTGRNQAKFGHVYNVVQGEKYTIPVDSIGLPLTEKTVGNYMRELGYKTGLIGKWHQGISEKFHPNNRGFDYFWGFLWGSNNYFAGTAKAVMENKQLVDPNSIGYMTDAIGEKSVSFIEGNRDKPFYLFVSFNAPHTPMQAKSEVLEEYRSKFSDLGRAKNAAMTAAIDENVGKILSCLEKNQLLENTIVFFTNDNGGQVTYSFSDNYPLRDLKGSIYEGGLRVPMAMMWKKKISPKQICDIPVTTLDLLPTYLAAAGQDLQKYKGLDGTDLLRILKHENKFRNRQLFWYLSSTKGAVRSGNWKYVWLGEGKAELFNLNTDVSEENNLSENEPQKLKELSVLYRLWKEKLPQPVWTPVK